MLKVRAMGSREEIRWFQELLANSQTKGEYNFQLGCPPLQARRALSGGQQICFSSG